MEQPLWFPFPSQFTSLEGAGDVFSGAGGDRHDG